jgi:hypothetical protein
MGMKKYPSGNCTMLEFRDGKIANHGVGMSGRELTDSLCLTRLQALVTAVQDEAQEVVMLLRSYFLHYRLIREILTAVAMVGTALLLSYLILQP